MGLYFAAVFVATGLLGELFRMKHLAALGLVFAAVILIVCLFTGTPIFSVK
jgi:hypothetical protein